MRKGKRGKLKKLAAAGLLAVFAIGMFFYAESSRWQKGITIAVLDTGYTGEHPRVLKTGINTMEETEDAGDFHGHGTNVTELILEQSGEQVFVLPVKITDNYGQATIESACRGIDYAVRQGADIISFSLAMEMADEAGKMAEKIKTVTDSGILFVTAAGNYGTKTDKVFPANEADAIVVSAVDSDNGFCTYSNYGESLDFSAYGYYKGDWGTSYAAARVSALLAEELLVSGRNAEEKLRERAVDKGASGFDCYYGHGVLETAGERKEELPETGEYRKKSVNDLGYKIMELDWKSADAETLNNCLIETDRAYVGMFLSQFTEEELKELKQKANVLNTDVLVQVFKPDENGTYKETEQKEVNFVCHALDEYRSYREKLTVAAEMLILQKNTGEFAISSENRENVYYYCVSGFSYRTDTPDSPYFQMFNPASLRVDRTVVREANPAFTAPYIADMDKYLRGASCFAATYTNPETGQRVEEKGFGMIAHEADKGSRLYGLSLTMGGYSSGKVGYHTSDENIVQIPYNYSHVYPQYSYAAYPEPLTYYFGREIGMGEVEWMPDPQRVESQPKSFKKLMLTNNYIVFYNGKYKPGYDYTNMDYSLSLQEMINRYIEPGYQNKNLGSVNIPTSQNSISENSFTINFDLHSSMAIQWNDGETPTKVIRNDIPEYNFPLVINTYTVRYDGNGATGGWMGDMPMTYNAGRNLFGNGFDRTGYTFTGWNTRPGGTGTGFSDGQWVNNLTDVHNAVVTLYAQWTPNRYNMTLNHMGGTYNGAGENTYPVICQSYDYCDVSWGVPTREGYTFDGFWSQPEGGTQVYDRAGHCINGTLYWNNGWQYRGDVTFYAHWIPHTYKICFDANGGEGSMADIEAVYDVPVLLPENSFTRANEYGQSVFRGWSTDAGASEPVYEDGAEVRNLTTEAGGLVVLYAIWDDCPWIVAEDLYYTLEEAQSGRITYEELMSHAAAEDREAGGPVLPGTDAEKGTSFTIIDYAETDFTQFTHEGSVTETYRVVDSIGNSYKKMITVFITDTAPEYLKPEGTTRFISEKYYYEPYERGGLEEDSIWKTNPEYVQVIKQAFENSRNNTPLMSFHFTHEEVLQMKEFVETNGIGNFNSSDALQRFYEQFMGDSKK